MTWIYILIFIISSYILVRSGMWVVKALIRIAQFLKLREFIVASFLMAFATSLPELFVGITSAISGKPELPFGVIIGSNIVALTVMVALGALLGKNLYIKGKILQKSALYAALSSLLPLLLILDGMFSRKDGMILLVALVFYFAQLIAREEKFRKVFNNQFKGWHHFKIFVKDMFIFLIGAVMLLLSAEGIVFSASKLAETFNLSLMIIGVSLVALGTSLPEIAFEIRAIKMGHKTMILGDIMGSIVINATLVLGLVGMISPFTITDFSPYLIGAVFTLIACLFFIKFVRSERKVTAIEALFLLGIYVLFIIAELYFR
ncbi:MAG: sodium:calcium antiporter [Candidatus Nealsonbacteria bacterium]